MKLRLLQLKTHYFTTVKEINGRTWLGLLGVFLAVMVSGIGENVIKVALSDVQGGMALTIDAGSWLTSCYTVGFIIGAGFTPCFWPTFSLRRVALCISALYLICGLLTPVIPSFSGILLIRILQGIAGGAMLPMLMTVVLRFMPPLIKVLGLGGYGLASAWSVSLASPVSVMAFHGGWQAYFYWNIPLLAIAMVCINYGLPQDPLRLERLKQFNWRGLFLGVTSLSMLVIGILQGERLDWFNSGLIEVLLLGGISLLLLFLLNEWFQPLPFFNLQLLSKRNLSYALITLGGVLIVMGALFSITSSYVALVQGYRQEQAYTIMLWQALPQIIALPVIAIVCNLPRVDCRWVLAMGLLLMGIASLLATELTSSWIGDNFRYIQLIQALAQPMAIIPLLMLATGGLLPTDGPFAAAWFNAVKGFTTAIASGLIALISRLREHFHFTVITDGLGYRYANAANPAELAYRVHAQTMVLTYTDLYFYTALFSFALLILIPLMPTRIYPPRPAINP